MWNSHLGVATHWQLTLPNLSAQALKLALIKLLLPDQSTQAARYYCWPLLKLSKEIFKTAERRNHTRALSSVPVSLQSSYFRLIALESHPRHLLTLKRHYSLELLTTRVPVLTF